MSNGPSLDTIVENRLLGRWAELLRRCPDQLNAHQQADAELVPLVGTDQVLAVTVDTVAEEISVGFYQEPETVGWMGAVVSLSDLAAVGARPLGIIASVTLPDEGWEAYQEGVARGLDAACRTCSTFVLGGDTNFAEHPSITCCAMGVVRQDQALARVGCQPGELLYASGPLGVGSAAALRAVFGLSEELFAESDYRPVPRVKEAQSLLGLATCCMDTSDGLISTLDQLLRLNGVGFELSNGLDRFLEPRTRAVAERYGIPPLMVLAGYHGDFELVFTIRQSDRATFETRAQQRGHAPLLLGRTIEEPILRVGEEPPRIIDGARIRNLVAEVEGDALRYVQELGKILAGPGGS